MPTIAEMRLNPLWRILCYGKFKSGKTAGAATFPRPRIIMLDPGGEETLLGQGVNAELEAKFGYSKNVVDIFIPKSDPRSNRGVPTAHVAYDACCIYFDEAMKKPESFDTWILDSGTSLVEVATSKAAILLGGGNDFTAKPISRTFEAAKKTGLFLPKLQDFGAERSLTEQFIDMLLDSNKNVIVLAHEKELYEGEGDASRMVGIGPTFTGQSVERIPLKFSEVYNLRNRKEGPNYKRYIQTQPDGIRACGSRKGVPNETEWNYSAITAALKTSTK